MTTTHEDTILLRLRREYSKDEAFGFINKRLKESEFKNGELISENAELLNTVSELKKKIKELTPKGKNKRIHPVDRIFQPQGSQTKKQWLKDELIADYERVAKIKHSKLNYAEKVLIEYRNKYLSLLNKLTSS